MIDDFDNGFVKCIDNFLPKHTFQRIQDFTLSMDMPWSWTETDYNVTDPSIDEVLKQDGNFGTFMFTHLLFTPAGYTSNHLPLFFPITDAFKERNIPIANALKLKLNMYTNTGERKYLAKHTDFYPEDKVTKLHFITAILCFTTDNGATIIGDKEYKTIENRCIVFDGNLQHHAYTQTDVKRRVILNLNYERSDIDYHEKIV